MTSDSEENRGGFTDTDDLCRDKKKSQTETELLQKLTDQCKQLERWIFSAYDMNKRKNALKFAHSTHCDVPTALQKRMTG